MPVITIVLLEMVHVDHQRGKWLQEALDNCKNPDTSGYRI